MPLTLDRDWTPALLHFVQAWNDCAEGIEGRGLAQRRPVRRFTYSAGNRKVFAHLAGCPAPAILHWHAGVIQPYCGCSDAEMCEHAYAAALVVLGEAFRRGSSYRAELAPLLPHSWRFSGTSHPPAIFDGLDRLFEMTAAPKPERDRAAAASTAPRPARAAARPAPPSRPTGNADSTEPDPPLWVHWETVADATLGIPGALRLTWNLRARQPDGSNKIVAQGAFRRLRHDLAARDARRWGDCVRLLEWLDDHNRASAALTIPGALRFAVHDPDRWLASWGRQPWLRWADGRTVARARAAAQLAIDLAPGAEPTVPAWAVRLPPATRSAGPGLLIPLGEACLVAESRPGVPRGTQDDLFGARSEFHLPPPPPEIHWHCYHEGMLYPVDTGLCPARELGALRGAAVAPTALADPQAGQRLMLALLEAAAGQGPANPWIQRLPVEPRLELRLVRERWIRLAVWAQGPAGEVYARTPAGEWEALADGALAARWREASPLGDAGDCQVLTAEPAATARAAKPARRAPAPANGPVAPLLSIPDPESLAPIEEWLERVVPTGELPMKLADHLYGFNWPATELSLDALERAWTARPRGTRGQGDPAMARLLAHRQRPPLKLTIENAEQDWLWVSLELEDALADMTAAELTALLDGSREARLRLPGGCAYPRAGLEQWRDELALIESLGLDLAPGRQKVHVLQWIAAAGQAAAAAAGAAAGGGADAGASAARLPDDSPLAPLRARLRELARTFTGVPRVTLAPALERALRPYQRHGVDVLAWAARAFGGALLADDMGLGKTFQILAAWSVLRRDGAEPPDSKSEPPPAPTLIVCPASVVRQWEREARQWLGEEPRIAVLEAGGQRREQLARLSRYDFVIASHALARRDRPALQRIQWRMIVLDEAQAIKNPESETAATMRALRGRYRFALTGTPIENRVQDLISILRFALPALVPRLSERELRDPLAHEGTVRRLHGRLRPVLVRRLKTEVAPELPDRIEQRRDCALADDQRRLYLAQLVEARARLSALGDTRVAGQGRLHFLAALMRLRQLCCHPALAGHGEAGSGKLEELRAFLPGVLEAGHKVLLFSQFVRMLELLEPECRAMGAPVYTLTGATRERQALVDRFEADPNPSVFLISLKAGGSGLNLTSASHVILFDPWWNPASEAQAIDRAHRIGQRQTVLATRLVTAGTIEERILALQERKRELVRQVLDPAALDAPMSREDMEFLLT